MAKVEILSISYSKRYNNGNYESEEFKAEGTVDGDALEGFAQLKGAVIAAAEVEAIPWTPSATKGTVSKVKPDSKSHEGDDDEEEEKPKKKATKKAVKKVETGEDEEDLEEEEKDLEEDDSEKETDEEVEKSNTAKGQKSKAGTKTSEPEKKSLRKKGSVYSRSSDLHKQMFVAEIKKVDSKFLSENGVVAKAISLKLDGSDFLDGEGAILKSFSDSLKKMMKAK